MSIKFNIYFLGQGAGSHIAEAELELLMLLCSQCWNYQHASLCLVHILLEKDGAWSFLYIRYVFCRVDYIPKQTISITQVTQFIVTNYVDIMTTPQLSISRTCSSSQTAALYSSNPNSPLSAHGFCVICFLALN